MIKIGNKLFPRARVITRFGRSSSRSHLRRSERARVPCHANGAGRAPPFNYFHRSVLLSRISIIHLATVSELAANPRREITRMDENAKGEQERGGGGDARRVESTLLPSLDFDLSIFQHRGSPPIARRVLRFTGHRRSGRARFFVSAFFFLLFCFCDV